MLHQGKMGPDGMTYTRIAFSIHARMHESIFIKQRWSKESMLMLHAATFCHDVMASVRSWYAVITTIHM